MMRLLESKIKSNPAAEYHYRFRMEHKHHHFYEFHISIGHRSITTPSNFLLTVPVKKPAARNDSRITFRYD